MKICVLSILIGVSFSGCAVYIPYESYNCGKAARGVHLTSAGLLLEDYGNDAWDLVIKNCENELEMLKNAKRRK